MSLHRQLLVVPLLLAVFSGCSDPVAPEAPEATEPATVQVTHRPRVPGEQLTTVRVEPRNGAVEITVERPAFCDTVVLARVARSSGVLAVVSAVGTAPNIACLLRLVQETTVVKYVITVEDVSSGTWNVQLFERSEISRSRLMATKQVLIPG